MPRVVIDLKDAAKYWEGEEVRFRQASLRGLLSASMRLVQIVQTVIIPSRVPQPVDRGTFRASWRFAGTNSGAEVWSDDPTASFIEDGVRAENVRPGRAMVAALTSWVVRKGMASAEDAPGVAWAIIRKMQRMGIFNRESKGLGIMREMNERYADTIAHEEVERELQAEFR